MLELIYQIQSLFMAIIIIFTSLFSIGSIPSSITMPELKAGYFGQWVNPFVGTGGYPWVGGNLFPGALSPFGAVKLSPDTAAINGTVLFNWTTSGYHYLDTYTLGFSHTRLSGTGSRDMGHFRVIPQTGSFNFAERNSKPLAFSHGNETATAGYYAVYLPSIGCMAELTATEHVGAHRYTFNTDNDALILIDSTSTLFGGRAEEGVINVNEITGEITGEARVLVGFSSRYDGLKAYFTASFNKPFNSYSTWADGDGADGRQNAAGNDCGAAFNFGNIKDEPLELLLAISFVSVDNARANMQAEAYGLDFEGVRSYSRAAWDSYLSRIDIDTDDEDIKTIFYTSLYHSMTMPTIFTDVNGEYLGFNRTIKTADDFTYYSDMSLWDTYRNTHPLYILIAPELQRDCLLSLLSMAKIGGTLPRWPSGGGYTGSMFGTPCDMIFAESYLKGITDFDVLEAFKYMKLTSDSKVEGVDYRTAVEEYNSYGYVPADVSKTSVSRTLEYAWADGSIALLAEALGKTAEAQHYKEKSLYYKNIFDDETKYFRGKNTDGSFVTPFSPDASSFYDDILGTEFARPYCEGSARHWRWSVVQDIDGLIELFGSEDYFVSELNEFMENKSTSSAGLDSAGGFWIGNEHNLHAPYLFNNANRADLTQKWVREVLSDSFGTGADNLAGNDDGGALSSWYVWSAIGLYPAAGTDFYWLGSPNVNKAIVNLSDGKILTIIAENQSPENVYAESVFLNGEKLSSSILTHSQIKDGGTLIFNMTNTPTANGGY